MKTIPLTQGYVALVDDADYPAVSAFKWHVQKCGKGFRAARSVPNPDGPREYLYLHQFLLPGARVDHEDGNALNNQRKNLRPATTQQNQRGFQRKRAGTSSRFRGVSWSSARGKWEAKSEILGKTVHLGRFAREKDAARAYNKFVQENFGEFAQPNTL